MVPEELETEDIFTTFQYAAIEAGFNSYNCGKTEDFAYIEVSKETGKRTAVNYIEEEGITFSNTDPAFDEFYSILRHRLNELA